MTLPRLAVLLAAAALCLPAAAALESIPAHRARQIADAAPAKPQVPPKKPRKVLVFVTPPHLMPKDPHKGYCIPYGTAAFEALGKKSGAYESVASDDLALFAPDSLRTFDAVILNNASGPWITPTDEDLAKPALKALGADKAAVEAALRKSFLDFVSNGGGVVAVHFAIAANRHWPEFADLIGGQFTGHPWNEEIGVTVEEPDHPLCAAFAGKDFRLADEIYEYAKVYDRAKLRVLLSLDPAHSNMGVRWIGRKDNDFALAWVKPHGKGRVFNTSFGHRTEIYWDPRILRFYLDAVQFAAGDLEAPTAPRDSRPQRQVPGTDPAPGLPGFVSLFNGKDLAGWDGDPALWSVQDGAIVGQTTADRRLRENNFLVWKDEVEDFELRAKFKLDAGNSGIYFRSRKRPPAKGDAPAKGEPLVGPQADFSADGRWTGVIMEYQGRDVLAERGQQVTIDEAGKKQVTGTLGDPKQLLAAVKPGEWNDYTVVAKGGRVTLTINGTRMCDLDDRDPKRPMRGWLAVQVHVGPPMRVAFKDVYLKRL